MQGSSQTQAFIKALLEFVLYLLKQGGAVVKAVGFRFTVITLNPSNIHEGVKMLKLQDDQKVVLSISPVDAAGNTASVDGAPRWGSSDDSIVSVQASSDGLSAIATAVGPLGQAQISVTADADLGSGTETLTGTLDVEVIGGKAVSLSISTGAPEPK